MMVIVAINNGGLFYMGYPIAVFAYALLLKTGPKNNFWYFVLRYTQILLIIQVFVSLFVFQVPVYTYLSDNTNYVEGY